jgi:hypothetical protein
MTFPTVVLSLIMATVFGAAFHVWRGGDLRRLALYLAASWLGFAVGHLAGAWAGLDLLRIGTLNAATATAGSALALFLTYWLAIAGDAGRKAEDGGRRTAR